MFDSHLKVGYLNVEFIHKKGKKILKKFLFMEFKKQDKNADKEEIQKLIKELPVPKRVKASALHYWMEKKYALDDELEAKIQQLQREYDIKSLPFYEKVSVRCSPKPKAKRNHRGEKSARGDRAR